MAPAILPFPLPLRVGTDICQISRIHRILAGPRGHRFVQRVLTPQERAAEPSRSRLRFVAAPARQDAAVRDEEAGLWKAAVFMAGRFAAKEAAIKAHSPRRSLTFHDITISAAPTPSPLTSSTLSPPLPPRSGPPVAVVSSADVGEPAREALLSISHDGDYATAVCLAFDPASESGL